MDNQNNYEKHRCEYPTLAMVYSPKQSWRMLYDADVALVKGTIFRELDKPLTGYMRQRNEETRR